MHAHASAETLLGLGAIVIGVALRLNLALVIVASALIAAVASGRSVHDSIGLIGHFFVADRYLCVVFAVLPLIGLLERHGLRDAARRLTGRLNLHTPGHVLRAYALLRQGTVAFGLTSFGGPAQMVRPVIVPMTEAAAEKMLGAPLLPALSQALRAEAAAIDNVASFFGEDIFVAFVSVLFMQATLVTSGVQVSTWQLSCWALPGAAMAATCLWARMIRLDRRLRRAGADAA